jgi:hypothetical protein
MPICNLLHLLGADHYLVLLLPLLVAILLLLQSNPSLLQVYLPSLLLDLLPALKMLHPNL